MWIWAALVVLTMAALGAWWWHSHRPAAPPGRAAAAQRADGAAPRSPGGSRRFGGGGGVGPVQPVSVLPARRQDIRVTVNAIGSLAASNTAVVRAQVSGVLQRLTFQEGQPVQAGQVIAQIDPRSFQATLAQAEGTLARDSAQLAGARVDLARYRGLVAQDGIPTQQLDSQVALVGQLQGTVKADQGVVDNARLQLSYTRVTAPISGRAGLKQADLGNVVQPGDANGIVSITQTRPIALVFAVPAQYLPRLNERLRAHEPVLAQALDRDGGRLLAAGRVATVDNAIDPGTDTIKVKVLFPNQDDALYPNQAVSVVLTLDTLHDTLAVPQAAVMRGANGFYVYRAQPDHTVHMLAVQPGAVDGGWMAVKAELQPGDAVVIDGADRLREGAQVDVIANDPDQRAGASAPPAARHRRMRPDEAGERPHP